MSTEELLKKYIESGGEIKKLPPKPYQQSKNSRFKKRDLDIGCVLAEQRRKLGL